MQEVQMTIGTEDSFLGLKMLPINAVAFSSVSLNQTLG